MTDSGRAQKVMLHFMMFSFAKIQPYARIFLIPTGL